MRFVRVEVKEIYFKDMLCDDFKRSRYPMPENIRKSRNRAITLSFLEIICCIASFAFYVRRRAKIVLGLLIMNILSTLFGFNAKVTLSYGGLMSHASYSISVIGGFYIYIMLDYFLTYGRR